MGCVCLILPLASADALSPDWVARCRRGLEEAGHAVEVLAVLEPDEPRPADPAGGGWTWVAAGWPGLSNAMVAGLVEAGAGPDFLVVLDVTRGYNPADVVRMVGPLADGTADLAVARRVGRTEPHAGPVRNARWRRWAVGGIGALSRPVFGVSEPFAGLVAMTPALARHVIGSFEPVGDRFTVDLVVRAKGRRADVPVRSEGSAASVLPALDDLRHFKRLADDRFGTVSRLIQFCAVGASGMVVDLSCYALFQLLFSWTRLAGRTAPVVGGPLDLAAAGAVAIALALTWNFSLNRRLTFNDARGGSVIRQYLTYALSNALGIALSLSLRLYLPAHVGFFDRHRLAAAVVGIITATGISFSMARWLVFNRRTVPRDPARAAARVSTVVETTPAR